VVIFLGGRRPLGLVIAAFVFGLAESFSNYAQGAVAPGVSSIPADFILAMPYLLTLLAMIFISAVKSKKN
jgi:simple sugar transport system permease protein